MVTVTFFEISLSSALSRQMVTVTFFQPRASAQKKSRPVARAALSQLRCAANG